MVDQQQVGILSIDVSFEACAQMVGEARRAVCSLAEDGGAGERDLERIRLAVSEAVSNAITHGYGDRIAGEVHLTAAVIGGELAVVIADDGCGLGEAPESQGLGLGLPVMTRMCDALSVSTRSAGGTQIEMRFRLAGGDGAKPCSGPRRDAFLARTPG